MMAFGAALNHSINAKPGGDRGVWNIPTATKVAHSTGGIAICVNVCSSELFIE